MQRIIMKPCIKMAYDFLTENEDTADTLQIYDGHYKLENTLTENGHVARGVCVTDEEEDIFLRSTSVPYQKSMTAYSLYRRRWKNMDHASGRQYSIHEYVGFSASILKELKDRF